MGQQQGARVDVAALRAVANRFDATAEIIDSAARTQLAGLTFGGASAGRVHTARGDALHAALDRLGTDLARWSRTSAEIAAALRAGAATYAEAERSSAVRLG